MAGVSQDNEAAEKGPEGSSTEAVPGDTTISRVKLLDTIVDTFLQKLVAGKSYERFASCYKHLHQLNPEATRWIYDKFVAQLQTSIREEISEIKEEGNLEAVLNSLDKIIEEGKDRGETAWRPSGIPEKDLCSVMAPYFLKQQDTLCRQVQKQEAKNQELAEAVLAGRRQVEELQQQVQAVQQTWQALHREQRELLSVLRAPE
ncbi:polyamine-modulated factor 1 [Rattus norvegicus]|uniref:Polyamine-modulated factor 1 n=1 Tax=Rattus norvegicus TaxID=10116 RepID=D3ZEH8_RAT|nr:polyamine-modulated factor 1 [Rattus norvegicus]|eukprot:NP_001178497.1 polyamine-modulated factor 1 [Rattus norvegicus]